jgi:sugar lactone lactonase YvrE
LLRFRESTGEITQRIGLADGLKRPDDLVVTPDGSMVYTSPLDGIVGRARPGSRPEILAHLNTPNPIVLEPSGNSVLVAETLLTTSRVLRVPLNGGTTQVVVNGLPPLNSFDLGTDGALYAPSGGIPTAATGTGGVVKLDPATGDYQQLVLKNPDGTSFKGFAMPVAAKFGQDGTLYVLQGINAAVFQVNVTTGVTSRLARLLSPSGDNLAVFSDHLVATGFDNHLTRINFDGTTSLVRVGR